MPKPRHFLRILLVALALPIAWAQDGLKFGDPGCDATLGDREFADRKYYQLCHSFDLKEPLWVGYVLTKADLDGPAPRPAGFVEDKLLKHPGAKDSDYVRSSFSRGHMAPAEDFSRSKQAIKTTFILSNVVPQVQSVNGGRWAQLELMVRNLVRQSGRAYIFTGPIFENDDVDTIGDDQVGVPTHTFKVILTVGPGETRKMYAVIMPNSDGVKDPVNAFTTTVKDVEDKTGFYFFDALDREERARLETTKESFGDNLTRKKTKPAKNRK